MTSPFPANTDKLGDAALAIKALAMSVDGRLPSVGVEVVNPNNTLTTNANGDVIIQFTRLGVIAGAIATPVSMIARPGNPPGRGTSIEQLKNQDLVWYWTAGAPSGQAYLRAWEVIENKQWANHPVDLCVIGWGTPK